MMGLRGCTWILRPVSIFLREGIYRAIRRYCCDDDDDADDDDLMNVKRGEDMVIGD